MITPLRSYLYTKLSLGVLISQASPSRRSSTTTTTTITPSAMPSRETLQDDWTALYKERLPCLAKKKDPSQRKWPVQLDHCFARIILDNAIGKDKPWTHVIKSPAYKHMTASQLEDAIALGEKLIKGEADLVALDEKSLALRGKRGKERITNTTTTTTGDEKAGASMSRKRKIIPEEGGHADTKADGKREEKKMSHAFPETRHQKRVRVENSKREP